VSTGKNVLICLVARRYARSLKLYLKWQTRYFKCLVIRSQ